MTETIEWIKVETRKTTEEEIEYFKEYCGDLDMQFEYIFDCKMPDDGEEILIQTKYGVSIDVCEYDYGYSLEGGDWDGVIAWARMPKGIEVEE